MDLAPNALTTEEQVKLHLGIDADDNSQDELIKFYINALSEQIESYTGRKFARVENETVIVSGRGLSRLFLPYLNVEAIASLSQDGILVNASGYSVDKKRGVLHNAFGMWNAGFENYSVVLTGGFILPKDHSPEGPSPVVRDLPYNLELACVKMVGRALNRRNAEGAQQASAGSLNVNFLQEMDRDTKQILGSYKIINV